MQLIWTHNTYVVGVCITCLSKLTINTDGSEAEKLIRSPFFAYTIQTQTLLVKYHVYQVPHYSDFNNIKTPSVWF